MSRTSTFADLLRTVVVEKHQERIEHSDHATVGHVVLRERDPNAVMKVSVTDIPLSAAVVRVGRLQHLSGIENGRWKKICDYLVVIPDGERSWAVLVEMKKTLAVAEKAEEQLRRSIPVVEYLRSLCEIELEKPIHVVMRYVVLVEKGSGRFDKERTRVTTGIQSEKELFGDSQVETIVGMAVAAKQLVGG